MSIFMQLLTGSCSAVFLTLGVLLIVIAIVGRPRATRPHCGACSAALRGHVDIPSKCPSCGVELSKPGTVRFRGYRFGWTQFACGVAVLALPHAVGYLTVRPPAAPAMAFAIPIERNPSAARFAEATAQKDLGAWVWIQAHLQADALGEPLRRDAAALAIESARSGHQSDEFEAAIELLGDLVDETLLAEAMLDAAAAPKVTVENQAGGLLRIDVEWGDPDTLMRNSELPRQRVYAVTAIRIDGERVRPSRPGGRAALMPRETITFVQAGVAAGSTPGGAASWRTVTVELECAVLRESPVEFAQWRLVGPPSSWPGVVARRTISVEIVATPQSVPE